MLSWKDPLSSPTVTKDGVTVAKEIELEDHFQNMGAKMVKEVASRTSDTAGDGTTTATVLARHREGYRVVAAGMNPMDVKRGIDLAMDEVVKELKKMSKPVKEQKEISQVRECPTMIRQSVISFLPRP